MLRIVTRRSPGTTELPGRTGSPSRSAERGVRCRRHHESTSARDRVRELGSRRGAHAPVGSGSVDEELRADQHVNPPQVYLRDEHLVVGVNDPAVLRGNGNSGGGDARSDLVSLERTRRAAASIVPCVDPHPSTSVSVPSGSSTSKTATAAVILRPWPGAERLTADRWCSG